jgi:di/tricarboxylate transporter
MQIPFRLSLDQPIPFGLFVLVVALLICGKWRYDLVAFSALIVAVLAGTVPSERAFAGIGHPATVTAAPVAVDVAGRLGASPDPFLMAVAVGASCAFLTPIGHQNNTLILGPGSYAFGDYWRPGATPRGSHPRHRHPDNPADLAAVMPLTPSPAPRGGGAPRR